MEQMRYVPYIKDERVNMQWFLSGMPQSFQTMIEFDEPKTLEDAIRKDRYCYEQLNHKEETPKEWKKKNEIGFKRMGVKYSRLLHIKNTHFDSVTSVIIISVASVTFCLQVSQVLKKSYCHDAYIVPIMT
jgi:hypothetical protein